MARLITSALLLALVALISAVAPAHADVPNGKPLYENGPEGRYLMDGPWLFRLDGPGDGINNGYHRAASRQGWTSVTVPNAWNVGDDSDESMAGDVGWYRKDFELPSSDADLNWIVRFESVNYRTRVWLNGKPIGSNRGAYLPFEIPLKFLKRKGTNRLVVRVDSKRRRTDFPPSGLTVVGRPTGGWWNYGGLIREVYLRKVDQVDWQRVRVRPTLDCATCKATVDVEALMRNPTQRRRTVEITGTFGSRKLSLGRQTIPAGATRLFEDRVTISDPELWSPPRPYLYDVDLTARVQDGTGKKRTFKKTTGYHLKTGIRSIKVSNDGRLQLNGQFTNFRGVGLHEDTRDRGFAITNADRDVIINETKALGATLMRTHYPFHPYIHEQADRQGLLIWSEIPVYSNKNDVMAKSVVRKLAAKELRENIENNGNHPSVIVWSIANELSSRPGPSQGSYIQSAANLARELDPTRPVGIAISGYPNAGCQDEYAPLDVIGINEYFGWYPGPNGQIFDRNRLSPYLDQVRQCYPEKAIVVTEFGAEANREGPVEEKGTWLFQQDFVNFHLGVHATKPWLSGSVYWALREFRVRPGWDGGNPRPSSPVHQKGVIAYDGTRKPAWADLQRNFAATQQLIPARRSNSAKK